MRVPSEETIDTHATRQTLRRLAEQHGDHLLAGPLLRYVERHGVDEGELARRLGISVSRLYELALKRRPTDGPGRQAVAEHFGIEPALLTSLLE